MFACNRDGREGDLQYIQPGMVVCLISQDLDRSEFRCSMKMIGPLGSFRFTCYGADIYFWLQPIDT